MNSQQRFYMDESHTLKRDAQEVSASVAEMLLMYELLTTEDKVAFKIAMRDKDIF